RKARASRLSRRNRRKYCTPRLTADTFTMIGCYIETYRRKIDPCRKEGRVSLKGLGLFSRQMSVGPSFGLRAPPIREISSFSKSCPLQLTAGTNLVVRWKPYYGLTRRTTSGHLLSPSPVW